jgi:hypothetical protein
MTGPVKAETVHATHKPERGRGPKPAAASPLLAGNQAMQALLRGGWVMPKLELGGVDDPEEREADAIADRVMRSAEGTGLTPQEAGGDAATTVRRQPAATAAPCSLPPGLEGEIKRLTQGGTPLSPELRGFFEPRLGRDLDRVRVHDDPRAAASARALGARAYAVGEHVGFAAGQFAPDTSRGRRLLAHELAHTGQKGGRGNQLTSRIIRRVPDKSKADPIKNELDSWWTSNSKLEQLWNGLGTDLPEAINDATPVTSSLGKSGKSESYKDLWLRSVDSRFFSQTAAGRVVLSAFATDTVAFARSHLSSQLTRLENLLADLERAAQQNKSPAAPTQSTIGGVEDQAKGGSRSTAPKPMADVRGIVDTATLVHFLQNWETILRTAPIGMRLVDTSGLLRPPAPPTSGEGFDPFPGGPSSQAAATGGRTAAPAPSDAGHQPILFEPNITSDAILASPNVEFIDKAALDTIRKVYQDCEQKRTELRELAEALLSADANLAVLTERGELAKVSALSGSSDAEAAGAITNVTKQNVEAIRRFLTMLGTPGTVDWKSLGPIHGYLLAGGAGGSLDWSEKAARGRFVQDYFKRLEQAEREQAQMRLYIDLGIGAAAFIAMLTPAAPLATAVLAASQAYGAASLAVSVGESLAADKNAAVLTAGAAAQVVGKDDARRAREDAESKRASMAFSILMTALPYLPSLARGGARAASAIGREAWVGLQERAMLLGGAGLISPGSDLLVDLAKIGVSRIAQSEVGGFLSLNSMLAKIRVRSRTLPFVNVGPALSRGGDERLLRPASAYGLSGYIRYHFQGPGTGLERYPIFMAPTPANQFANNQIEGFMRRHRDAGASVRFSATYTTFSSEELRPFVEGILKSGDKAILNRLALDRGRIENFLKEVNYDIIVVRGASTSRYRAGITIGPPGSATVAGQLPTLVPP